MHYKHKVATFYVKYMNERLFTFQVGQIAGLKRLARDKTIFTFICYKLLLWWWSPAQTDRLVEASAARLTTRVVVEAGTSETKTETRVAETKTETEAI